jgi:puromycin-sensitive aminopeptidase
MQSSLLLCLIIGTISYQFYFVGAMENWGLITYRETCLLVDPENTSTVQKQWIALTVGHEIAHQWFGNLVTMVRSCILSMLW